MGNSNLQKQKQTNKVVVSRNNGESKVRGLHPPGEVGRKKGRRKVVRMHHRRENEGSEGYYSGDCLSEIGHTPGVGSEVVAYWQNVPWWDPINYTYAFLAKVSARKPGHFWVKHEAGGDEEWVPEHAVHALKRM